MENQDNVKRCSKCGLAVIDEEASTHECFEDIDVWIINGKIWAGDGRQYFPLKVHHHFFNTTKKHPDKETVYENIHC